MRTPRPGDQRIQLTAQADAERGVEERGHEREPRRDLAEPRRAAGEPDDADRREGEADDLGELQRRYRFALGDRAEAGGDEVREEQPVRAVPGTTQRADREYRRLPAQNHRRDGRAD